MGPFASYTLLCFGSVFSIVDPFSAIPVYLALVGGESKQVQQRTALAASLTCFCILNVFGFAGTFIFAFFGITIFAFKIAGGLLLFGVAIDMLRAQRSHTKSKPEELERDAKEGAGLIPLGLPLLSGPGAIATVMMLSGKASSVAQKASVHMAVFLVSVSAYVLMRSAMLVSKAIGQTGINIIERMMGLILAAIACQFILDGIHESVPFILS